MGEDKRPKIHPSCFIAPNATIVGDVEIAEGCGIWYNAVIRADLNPIRIGKNSNVQDNCIIHVSEENGTFIGENVSIGHGAMVHGARISNNVIVGIKAVVLDGAEIGEGSVIGAGAVVKSGMRVPPKSLVVGVPGRIVRENDDSLLAYAIKNAEVYQKLRDEHRSGIHKVWGR